MTLKARLVIAIGVLILIVIAALGVVVVRSSSEVLVGQVDELLDGVQSRSGGRLPLLPAETTRGFRDVASYSAARMIVAGNGEVVLAEPSGFSDDPDPLPDPAAVDALLATGEVATIPSVDGSIDYRAVASEIGGGLVSVVAVPLGDVTAALDSLVRMLWLTGIVMALVAGAVAWWTVNRAMKPVDRMVDTATRIAGGELSHRIEDNNPETELGSLGVALNDMLAKIELAFDEEQRAKDRLKQFVADASHELRTPIAAVRGYTELYRRGALSEVDDLDRAMTRIGMESSRMEHLVEDLLLLARIDRGMAFEVRPVNLAAVVGDAVTDSRAIDPNRPISIKVPSSVSVIGDERRLLQVVANLLANARTHTPPGTPVSVALTESKTTVTIEVADEGPGLPEDAEKLFNRFHRSDDSRTRSSGGAGLGLAIVAAIVGAHGGTVEAATRSTGGAVFRVKLPTRRLASGGPLEVVDIEETQYV